MQFLKKIADNFSIFWFKNQTLQAFRFVISPIADNIFLNIFHSNPNFASLKIIINLICWLHPPEYFYSEVIHCKVWRMKLNYWQIKREKFCKVFGCWKSYLGSQQILIAIESTTNRHENFSILPRTRFIQKFLQLTKIIVEIIFHVEIILHILQIC